MGVLDELFTPSPLEIPMGKIPTLAELQEYLREVENDINTTQNQLLELERLREQVLKEITDFLNDATFIMTVERQ